MINVKQLVALALIVVLLTALIVLTIVPVAKNITLGLDLQGGFEVLYRAEAQNGEVITHKALTETAAALERRIDVLGVSETTITIEGEDRIRVQLAGVTDQADAREVLGKPAKLTFRNAAGDILLDGTELVVGGAGLDFDNLGNQVVVLKLKDADKFRDITKKYLHQVMAIYLDEDLITAPVIESVITSGNAIITGKSTVEEAQRLADLLNAGALPLELTEMQAQSVGATLGMKALELTIIAGIIGSIIVLLYMIAYYRVPGLIASFSLVVYLYIVLLIFWQLNVTLTLSGIAALVLGVGMAVDANILTYERVREELKTGKSLLSSVRAGSRRSLVTIVDANITTILAAVVLFIFSASSGSVRGFAITLIISILVSMLTAVYGSRFLLNLLVKSNAVTNPRAYGVKEEDISAL